MAQCLPREFGVALLATALLLLVAGGSDAQPQPTLPPIPAGPPTLTPVPAPNPAEPAPAPKELSKEEIDGLIEKAFGKNCAELKRPVRVWIPDIGMILAADKATVAHDGQTVHFASASARLP